MKRLLTGMRITSNIHIGNYFGVIPTLIQNADSEIFLFGADLHSLTNDVRCDYYEVMKLFMATTEGMDVKYYMQSNFNQFAMAAWFMTCNTSIGDLKRMTQFKSQDDKESVNSGYLFYPTLMCADILLPMATHVPVGIDQVQHVELARDLAKVMNNRYNCGFIVPECIIAESFKIMDLREPTKKMSKSNYSEHGTIFLKDTPDEIRKKVMGAKTDALMMPEDIEVIKDSRVEVYALCCLFKYVTGRDFTYIQNEFGGHYSSKFKEALSVALIDKFDPLRLKMNDISNHHVDMVLSSHLEYIDRLLNVNLDRLKKCVLGY
jgi:tryptophanyl-tRNA synthetase